MQARTMVKLAVRSARHTEETLDPQGKKLLSEALMPENYYSLRSEIVSHDAMLNWTTLIVLIVIVAGCAIIEHRETILSVFLPLITLAWSSGVLRFDFFIHRQGAYLRQFETTVLAGTGAVGWEFWKAHQTATRVVVPLADSLGASAIFIPTAYLLFGPARGYFATHGWRGGTAYAWTVLGLIACQLITLAFIPAMFP